MYLSFRTFDVYVKANTNKVSKRNNIKFALPQATGLQNVTEEDANLRIRAEFALFLLGDGALLEINCGTEGNFGSNELTFLVAHVPRTVSVADLRVPTKAPTANGIRPHARGQAGLLEQSLTTTNGDLDLALGIAVRRGNARGRSPTGKPNCSMALRSSRLLST